MKKERKTSKSMPRASDSSESDDGTPDDGNREETVVRLKNADIFAKYQNKNSNISIDKSKCVPAFVAEELSDDDEIWIGEVPCSIDLSNLIGQTIKLGSKQSILKAESENAIECVSDTCNTPIVTSLVCAKKNGQLVMRNMQTAGYFFLRKRAEDPVNVSLDRFVQSEGRPDFPNGLKVRHPLHGIGYKELVTIDERTKEKLNAAHMPSSVKKSRKRKTTEVEAKPEIESTKSISKSKSKHKKDKYEHRVDEDEEEIVESKPKKIKTEIPDVKEEVSDLAWIKNI